MVQQTQQSQPNTRKIAWRRLVNQIRSQCEGIIIRARREGKTAQETEVLLQEIFGLTERPEVTFFEPKTGMPGVAGNIIITFHQHTPLQDT